LDEILYLKADGSYTQFYLTEGRKITVSKRLQEYERIISLGNFQRIHRSHIVNLHHIAKNYKRGWGAGFDQ
jgi:two-component system LytT family response regulator